MKTKTLFTLSLLSLSIGLTACGAKSDPKKSVRGTLVVPKASKKVIAKVLQKANGVQFKETCSNVPAGYKPLKGVKVEFVDSGDKTLDDTKTNECGEFSASVPEGVVKVKAKSSGNKELVTDVSVFQSTGATSLASTIPSNAEYQISSMQMTADNKIAFSVTDTVTNNAVIGIPDSALSAKIGVNNVGISKLDSAANISDPASVTLVMDASPSMLDKVRGKNQQILKDDKGHFLSRFRVATIAAHSYLDNVPESDESSLIVFDEYVRFLNDQMVSNLFRSLQDKNGNSITYKFSEDGFTKKESKLRLLVDLYNPYSTLYTNFPFSSDPYIGFEVGAVQLDKKHKDSPDVNVTADRAYPWTSGTSIFDGIGKALDTLTERKNARKIVIAMSDGGDNRSSLRKSQVINSAKAKAIPVHTIFFSDFLDSSESRRAKEAMSSIAKDTNASFIDVKGTNLVSAFRSIQTSITFQYLANLIDKAKTGDKVTISLNYNGVKASRSVTR